MSTSFGYFSNTLFIAAAYATLSAGSLPIESFVGSAASLTSRLDRAVRASIRSPSRVVTSPLSPAAACRKRRKRGGEEEEGRRKDAPYVSL